MFQYSFSELTDANYFPTPSSSPQHSLSPPPPPPPLLTANPRSTTAAEFCADSSDQHNYVNSHYHLPRSSVTSSPGDLPLSLASPSHFHPWPFPGVIIHPVLSPLSTPPDFSQVLHALSDIGALGQLRLSPLLLYLLLRRNRCYRLLLFSQSDADDLLVLPLLRLLNRLVLPGGKNAYERKPHQDVEDVTGLRVLRSDDIRLCTLVCLILHIITADTNIKEAINKTRLASVDWFMPGVSNISTDGVVVGTLLKVISWNFGIGPDVYLHEVCTATLINFADSLKDLHSVVAGRLVDYFTIVSKQLLQHLTRPHAPQLGNREKSLCLVYRALLWTLLAALSYPTQNVNLLYSLIRVFPHDVHRAITEAVEKHGGQVQEEQRHEEDATSCGPLPCYNQEDASQWLRVNALASSQRIISMVRYFERGLRIASYKEEGKLINGEEEKEDSDPSLSVSELSIEDELSRLVEIGMSFSTDPSVAKLIVKSDVLSTSSPSIGNGADDDGERPWCFPRFSYYETPASCAYFLPFIWQTIETLYGDDGRCF